MSLFKAGMVRTDRGTVSRPGVDRKHRTPRMLTAAVSVLLLTLGLTVAVPVQEAAAAPCTGNEIACENQLPGTDPSVWDAVDGAGDDSIQGFTTQISVNRGQPIDFKIKTDATAYTIQIFRLGYYQGLGARKVADVTPSATLPQSQPACATDPDTEIYDCGTWGVSASWAVPSTAVSGVYIALLHRADRNDSSQVPFIVRNDASHSDVVFQTSDPTWQAYNTYGGSNFYQGLENGRAYKVSYNRPFATRGLVNGRDYLFSNEYPMIRFLERNGYDTSYISGLDTDIRGNLLTNHKAFVSVGHDEYWSAGQRSNVESARDAGVNLAFFSGNEVYWKTRWEASEDGSGTPNRTLVCYKDTWADTQLDPVESTATWRDPRFGDNGHGPENALTGTAYMSNDTDLPITVNAEEGKLRLWRNTPLAGQAPGSSTALAPHTVGYESDEDLDNGYRPAGLVRLSTTTGAVPQYLQDFGRIVAPGTTTHHLTMYKAPSGALVFGAGTVQWAWGLDTNHDGVVAPVSVPMQQATVNLLADMSAAATTLSTPGVVAASKTTDTSAPTAVITSPTTGDTIAQGNIVTVTGTATDAGGGVVAGVEVSLDGGTTWHPADGRASFSYTGVVGGTGASVVQARAIDDSGNIQSPASVVNVPVDCPCSIFGDVVPTNPAAADATPVTLGVRFSTAEDGFITGLRFYKGDGNTGTHTGTLYKDDGTVLSTVTYTNESTAGWQTATFPSAVPISAGETYVASYVAPNGHYSADTNYFAYSGKTTGPLTALGGPTNANGVYTTGSGMPSSSYQQTNYYVDVVYSPTDTTPLAVTSASPVDGASSVPTSTTVSATFSRAPSVDSISFGLQDAGGSAVSGTTSYDAAQRTATFTPNAPLQAGTEYRATVMASAQDVGPMAAPSTWTFTTAQAAAPPGVCPCGLYNDGDLPTVITANDPNSVELGVAFTADTDGVVTGVRFYKGPSNTGVHTIALWTSDGTQLATSTVSQESTTGWQTASFSAGVPVTSGTTYIASYRAPVGRYSYNVSGLAAPIDRPPLHTPANAGRYSYGSGAPLTSSSASYFVDPVFTVEAGAAPTVNAVEPADQETSVSVGSAVTVTFSTTVQPGSASIVVTGPDGPVAGTVANQSLGTTASFTPTGSLAESTSYTVTVSGARNLGGVEMVSPFTSTFITSGATACPCSLLSSTSKPPIVDAGDASAISVGLRFSANADGFITALRYYRAESNTGTHTGSLFTSNGTKLAGLTFTDSGTGWQTATFTTPVAVTAGTTYVAQVFMPNGHYSAASAFFANPVVNGPLTGTLGTYAYGSDTFPTGSWNNSHYYVDVVYTAQDTFAPTVTAKSPDGIYLVQPNAVATATFARPIDPQSAQMSVTSAGGAAVPGSTTYDSASLTATFTPSSALAAGTSYTATVQASSTAGVAMPQPESWQFSTVTSTGAGDAASIYTPSDTPQTQAWPDNGPITVGVKFTPSRPGTVQAVKFYAGAGNNGPYDVAIWSPDGTKLGSARATGNASGWTTVLLDAPVAVTGGTTYVASYRGSSGHYSLTPGGLSGARTVGPLSIPANGGVYSYPDAAPSVSTSSEFFVDVVANLDPAPPAGSVAPAVVATAPDGANRAQPDATVTATFDSDIAAGSLSFSVTAAGGAAVGGTTTYDSASRTATFTPSAALALGTSHSASVTASSTLGTPMPTPASWSFDTVAQPATGTEYSLYAAADVPANQSWNDPGPVTVGMRFTTAQDGFVTAVRMYVGPGNTGPWAVDLWDSSGARIGSGTAFGTASGWKTVLLDSSVAVHPGVEYRASYRGASGHYAVTSGGLANGRSAGPLTIPGVGGVYSYPQAAPGATTAIDFGVDVVLVVP